MKKTCGCYFNTYNASIPLAPKEQGCFYGRPTADIHIHARTEPKGKDSYNYTKVIVNSIDDFEWGAWIEAVPFTGQELWSMQKDYIEQLPKTGATEENFRDFFASRGFTSFDGRMFAETRSAAKEDPFAAIRNNLAAAVNDPVMIIEKALDRIVKTEAGRFLLDKAWGRIPDDYDISVLRVTGLQDKIYCGIYDADIDGSVGLEIPVNWLQNEDTLRKASAEYWKQKEKQTELLEQQKEKEAEKTRLAQEKKERELYMELKRKYGGK